jgi:predicted O-methyltransferase YrrM
MTPTCKTALNLIDTDLALLCEATTTAEPEICRSIRRGAKAHPKAHWISGPLVGTMLQIFVSSIRAKSILDVGTFLGYSAAYLASGSRNARVASLESNGEYAQQAVSLLASSMLAKQITVHNVALENWLSEHPTSRYDVIFFDATRNALMAVYEQLVAAVNPGGLLIMDNAVLRRGVLRPERPFEKETATFNATIQRDRSFLTTLLPVRDGLLIAHKLHCR